MKLTILGPPGSGKGTMASLIAKKHKLKHIEVGELLRDLASKETKLGKLVKKNINKGKLVPSYIANSLVKKNLSNNFIIDGYPRELGEAIFLDKVTRLDKVISLEATKKTIIERLSKRLVCRKCDVSYHLITKKPKIKNKCDICKSNLTKREDDKPKAIKQRVKLFKKETSSVIKHYNKKSILVKINANRTVKKIFQDIEKCLSK